MVPHVLADYSKLSPSPGRQFSIRGGSELLGALTNSKRVDASRPVPTTFLPVSQQARLDSEVDPFALTGFEFDPLKSHQTSIGLPGPGSQVQLNHRSACALAGIANLYGGGLTADLKVSCFETGVAQAVAECK